MKFLELLRIKLRIISGKYKGRIFEAPKGLDVRPTTDRVREAMFSSAISIFGPLDNACVLDAFAGSGALGFESISRGATHLVSFENNKKTYDNLLKNFQLFKDENTDVKILFADVKNTNFEYVCKNKFDILFFDPPYKNEASEVVEILRKLKEGNLINNEALLVYEHSAKIKSEDLEKIFDKENFELKNAKIYGDIAVEYLIFK